jgi:hypothetical protein
MPWHLQGAFHERLVDDELRGIICERGVPDQFDVPGERLEIPLHPVHAHGDGVDQAEVFRVLGENRREVAMERHVVAHQHPVADAHGEPHAFVVGVPDADREPDAGDAEFKVQHPEHPHTVVRDGVLVANHFDAPEAEGFEKRLHDLIVRKRLMG